MTKTISDRVTLRPVTNTVNDRIDIGSATIR